MFGNRIILFKVNKELACLNPKKPAQPVKLILSGKSSSVNPVAECSVLNIKVPAQAAVCYPLLVQMKRGTVPPVSQTLQVQDMRKNCGKFG